MSASKVSDDFEQQIHRAYELLADSGAQVTWNDHIPDPDNPAQARQIDITIRRDGTLTLVECRKRKGRQDVKWIEELIGRRASLDAHAVIAVSSSGFTKGARAKAAKHGITLRDLRRLSSEEIENWGHRATLTLFFYQYSELDVSLFFDRESLPGVIPQQAKLDLTCHPVLQSLFSAAAQKLGEASPVADKQPGRIADFGVRIRFEDLRLCDVPIREASMAGKARIISQDVAAPLVYVYGAPDNHFTKNEAMIEAFSSLGKTSVTHDGKRIWTFLDLSELEIPPFCQFRFFRQVAGQELDHEAIEFQLGQNFKQLRVTGKGLKVKLCSL